MSKLWQKAGSQTSQNILSFTVGEDRLLDSRLIEYDVVGSLAHARGLVAIGVLTESEARQLSAELSTIHGDWMGDRFNIEVDDEDIHSALERVLCERLGKIGKKIHAGRSRNDQVLTALRLFMKDSLLLGLWGVAELAEVACAGGQPHLATPMPGYTHGQRAMPSTLAFWYASFADSLADTLEAGRALYDRLDSSPLGAAAGFGVPLPLDRELTARLMGFARVQVNAAAVQASRGRCESALLGWLFEACRDVEKMACDLLLYASSEYGFVSLPEVLCTGSSIMPQKKNPDVLELLRATPAVVRSCRDEVEHVIGKLPSSYHRDFQLTKRPLIRGLDQALNAIAMFSSVLPDVEWRVDRMAECCSTELFATHRAVELVREGAPFREAYRRVAEEIDSGESDNWGCDASGAAADPPHLGAPGNPGLDEARARAITVRNWAWETRQELHARWEELLKWHQALD